MVATDVLLIFHRRTPVCRTDVRSVRRTPVRVNPANEQMLHEQMFDLTGEHQYGGGMADASLTARQREILDVIERHLQDHGYPPSVREIGEAVGLPRRPPCTTTSPRCSASATCAVTPPSHGRSRSASTRASGADGAAPGAPRPARRRRRRRHRRPRPGERRGAATRSRPTSPATASCSCCGSGATP